MTYVFRCRKCGAQREASSPDAVEWCDCLGGGYVMRMPRDYRAEGANVDLRGLRSPTRTGRHA